MSDCKCVILSRTAHSWHLGADAQVRRQDDGSDYCEWTVEEDAEFGEEYPSPQNLHWLVTVA